MTSPEDRISRKRIDDRIRELARIGASSDGSINRLSFTAEDRAGRDLAAEWFGAAGLEVRLDGAGNLIGRREGTDPAAQVVMTGSHLDSQPKAGRYDGVAGVVAALESLEAIRVEQGSALTHPIEVVAWAGEEAGARFDVSMIGSRAMIGALTPGDLESRCRLTGMTLGAAMGEAGIDVGNLSTAERPLGSIKAVVELHIEQGPRLERASVQIGIVTDIAGYTRIPCAIRGQQAHSGAMPMEGRRDALCGAAEVILAVEAAARAREGSPVTATVGYLQYEPRAIAVVPGGADMIIDVRSSDLHACGEVVAAIEDRIGRISATRGLDVVLGTKWGTPPTRLEPQVAQLIARACEDLRISHEWMTSGAGHDAMVLGRRFPTGMLFVPSAGGISHAPEEFTKPEDLEAGARVLCRVLRQLAA